MTEIATPAAPGWAEQREALREGHAARDRKLFFGLLLLATLLPFLGMPLLARLSPAAPSLAAIRDLVIFLGGSAHVAMTAVLYADRPLRRFFVRHPGRYIAAPLLLVLGTALVYHAFGQGITANVLLAYFVWQTYHYMRQNYGVLAFAAAATGSRPHWLERAVLDVGVAAGILGMVRIMSLQLHTPFDGYEHVLYRAGLLAYAAVPVLVAAACLADRRILASPLRWGFLLLCAVFYLPTFLFPDVTSAILSYALAHGFQYFVFMYFLCANRRASRGLGAVPLLALAALLGGGLLAAMNDRSLWGGFGGLVFGAYLGLVMSHFVIDAGVWRMSGDFQRRYLSDPFRFLFARG